MPQRSARTTKSSATAAERGTPRAAPAACSPLEALQRGLADRPRLPDTLTEDALLSVEPDIIIGKSGVRFHRIDLFSRELDDLVTLPPAWRGRTLSRELRYDAAALSRNTLESVLVVVRDEHGIALKSVRCVPRDVLQRTADREEQARAQERYRHGLLARRAALQATYVELVAGTGAAANQRDLQTTQARRPRTRRTGPAGPRNELPTTTASPAPMTPILAPATPGAGTAKAPGRPTASTGTARPRRSTTPQSATALAADAGAVRARGSAPRGTREDAIDVVAREFAAKTVRLPVPPGAARRRP